MSYFEIALLINFGAAVLLALMCAGLISSNKRLTKTNASLTRANIDTNHLYYRSLKDLADAQAKLVRERRKWPIRDAVTGQFEKRGI